MTSTQAFAVRRPPGKVELARGPSTRMVRALSGIVAVLAVLYLVLLAVTLGFSVDGTAVLHILLGALIVGFGSAAVFLWRHNVRVIADFPNEALYGVAARPVSFEEIRGIAVQHWIGSHTSTDRIRYEYWAPVLLLEPIGALEPSVTATARRTLNVWRDIANLDRLGLDGLTQLPLAPNVAADTVRTVYRLAHWLDLPVIDATNDEPRRIEGGGGEPLQIAAAQSRRGWLQSLPLFKEPDGSFEDENGTLTLRSEWRIDTLVSGLAAVVALITLFIGGAIGSSPGGAALLHGSLVTLAAILVGVGGYRLSGFHRRRVDVGCEGIRYFVGPLRQPQQTIPLDEFLGTAINQDGTLYFVGKQAIFGLRAMGGHDGLQTKVAQTVAAAQGANRESALAQRSSGNGK